MERAPILDSSDVFTLDSHLSLSRNLGARQYATNLQLMAQKMTNMDNFFMVFHPSKLF
jgi:hypothetical protein